MSVVIVAIPKEDDYVWKISSEKVPHMTLLFLGESIPEGTEEITKFLEHASNFTLQKFWMDVEKRGTLGEDDADVLFFRKSEWNIKVINEFRAALLKNDSIKKAYDSVEQFPEWNPHLTLGYPETPAKLDTRDHPGFFSVNFDRIALWYGDYEGPTFELKDYEWDEVAMDATTAIERVLAHYGVKGMKWGRRQAETTSVKVSQKGKKLKTEGGTGQKAHADAIRKAKVAQTKKKSGVNALSDKELNAYANRLQLEQRVKGLEFQSAPAPKRFVLTLLGNSGKQAAQQVANEATTKAVKKTMAKKAIKTVAIAG
jgi:2'-5' RNA ligase